MEQALEDEEQHLLMETGPDAAQDHAYVNSIGTESYCRPEDASLLKQECFDGKSTGATSEENSMCSENHDLATPADMGITSKLTESEQFEISMRDTLGCSEETSISAGDEIPLDYASDPVPDQSDVSGFVSGQQQQEANEVTADTLGHPSHNCSETNEAKHNVVEEDLIESDCYKPVDEDSDFLLQVGQIASEPLGNDQLELASESRPTAKYDYTYLSRRFSNISVDDGVKDEANISLSTVTDTGANGSLKEKQISDQDKLHSADDFILNVDDRYLPCLKLSPSCVVTPPEINSVKGLQSDYSFENYLKENSSFSDMYEDDNAKLISDNSSLVTPPPKLPNAFTTPKGSLQKVRAHLAEGTSAQMIRTDNETAWTNDAEASSLDILADIAIADQRQHIHNVGHSSGYVPRVLSMEGWDDNLNDKHDSIHHVVDHESSTETIQDEAEKVVQAISNQKTLEDTYYDMSKIIDLSKPNIFGTFLSDDYKNSDYNPNVSSSNLDSTSHESIEAHATFSGFNDVTNQAKVGFDHADGSNASSYLTMQTRADGSVRYDYNAVGDDSSFVSNDEPERFNDTIEEMERLLEASKKLKQQKENEENAKQFECDHGGDMKGLASYDTSEKQAVSQEEKSSSANEENDSTHNNFNDSVVSPMKRRVSSKPPTSDASLHPDMESTRLSKSTGRETDLGNFSSKWGDSFKSCDNFSTDDDSMLSCREISVMTPVEVVSHKVDSNLQQTEESLSLYYSAVNASAVSCADVPFKSNMPSNGNYTIEDETVKPTLKTSSAISETKKIVPVAVVSPSMKDKMGTKMSQPHSTIVPSISVSRSTYLSTPTFSSAISSSRLMQYRGTPSTTPSFSSHHKTPVSQIGYSRAKEAARSASGMVTHSARTPHPQPRSCDRPTLSSLSKSKSVVKPQTSTVTALKQSTASAHVHLSKNVLTPSNKGPSNKLTPAHIYFRKNIESPVALSLRNNPPPPLIRNIHAKGRSAFDAYNKSSASRSNAATPTTSGRQRASMTERQEKLQHIQDGIDQLHVNVSQKINNCFFYLLTVSHTNFRTCS